MMKKWIIIFLVFSSHFSSAQFSNRIWCFGDSAGINFSIPGSPTTFSSGMDGRGTCISIADSLNQLLFYSHTGNWDLWWNGGTCECAGRINNKNHLKMENGDSLVAEIGYDQMAIVPFPYDSSKFYVIYQETLQGLFYAVVDLSYNSGLGYVLQKNVQISNLETQRSLAQIKHGNGRDWWVISHLSNGQTTGVPTNEFSIYLISSSGIQGPTIQSIGTSTMDDGGCIKFSNNGKKIVRVCSFGLVELFDFDRCTGVLSNPVTIHLNNAGINYFVGAEFSSNDSVLYISSTSQPSLVLQYDLSAPNISSSEDTIASIGNPIYPGGCLRIAPDNKIYWGCAWNDGVSFNYPYPDSAFNIYNMNLSVINSPNLLGSSCDFQPFSFYLGGKRTYYGLPNNPDYNMLALGGSLCDTLGYPNLVSDNNKSEGSINIFYHNDWQTAFINAAGLRGSNCFLHVINLSGQEVFSEPGKILLGYYTKDLQCANLKPGTYIVLIETEKDRLVKKFVRE